VFVGRIRIKRFGRIGWVKMKTVGGKVEAEDKGRRARG